MATWLVSNVSSYYRPANSSQTFPCVFPTFAVLLLTASPPFFLTRLFFKMPKGNLTPLNSMALPWGNAVKDPLLKTQEKNCIVTVYHYNIIPLIIRLSSVTALLSSSQGHGWFLKVALKNSRGQKQLEYRKCNQSFIYQVYVFYPGQGLGS